MKTYRLVYKGHIRIKICLHFAQTNNASTQVPLYLTVNLYQIFHFYFHLFTCFFFLSEVGSHFESGQEWDQSSSEKKKVSIVSDTISLSFFSPLKKGNNNGKKYINRNVSFFPDILTSQLFCFPSVCGSYF